MTSQFELEVITRQPPAEGRPTPLLFVHGMWHGAWCWQEAFLPFFAEQGYTAVALSLRGHANSQGHERLRWHRLADYVSDVLRVANQFERPPVLIGHSMGGAIVQKALETYPAPAAVLLGSIPPHGLIPATLRLMARHPVACLQVVLTLAMYPIVATPALARDALFTPELLEDDLQAVFGRLQNESFRAFLDLLGLDLPHPRRVETPVLVLGADDDRLISAGEVRATARAYGATAEFLPLAHDMMLGPGWQAVARRILAWLAERGL